jgi:hypothetical protein
MRYALALALFVLIPAVVLPADISGTWLGTMDSPYGAIETTLTLVSSNAGLTGTVRTQYFESKIENAKIDADKISFEINTEYGKIAYAGVAAGEEIRLNVTGPDGGQMQLTVKKQK